MAHRAIGISIKDLSLNYGGAPIFHHLNLEIAGGTLVALLGPSGVGKSSLLKVLAGLIAPASGTVCGSDGKPIFDRISYMAQQDLLFPWLSVYKNVTLGARLRREKIDHDKALDLLQRVELLDVKDSLPQALSGGMRQRAAIARTLYEDRPIVLMDEPFSALDTVTRASIHELAINVLQNKTVVLITHDPLEAARLSNHIIVLQGMPASFSAPIDVPGQPPRQIDDPDLQLSHSRLMHMLTDKPHGH